MSKQRQKTKKEWSDRGYSTTKSVLTIVLEGNTRAQDPQKIYYP